MREWVCLLGAINLGARNKVAMPRLRAALSEAGFADVRTYLQTGNVVLRTDTGDAGEVAEAVRWIVEKHFGTDTPVLTRTPQQIRDVLAWCPFPADAAARPVAVHVVRWTAVPGRDGSTTATVSCRRAHHRRIRAGSGRVHRGRAASR
jgi:uncharacterized protein (DUF1697 family)